MVENRATFFERIKPFFAPSVVRKIELAYILSKYAHRGQIRQEIDEHGEPLRYFEHVRRATLIGIDLAKIVRFDTVCASVLHDTLEDTPLQPELLEDCFGADVVGIVKVLSKVPKEGYLERFAMSPDWRPYFVKACDRLDNLRSMSQATVAFRRKQVAETRDKYYALFDRMVKLSPEDYVSNLTLLRDEIHRATDAVPVDS